MSKDDSRIDDLVEANKRLEEANSELTEQVKSLKESRANIWQMRFWAGKKIGEIFLGWRLSNSIKQLVREIKGKNVKNETIGDVLTHILWRFTRVGMITLMLAVIPSAILIVQTKLLCNQNRLLDIQNERVAQQNQLIEAQRRSSYVFLMGNIMDSVNEELKDNTHRSLSPNLIGQIIALSQSLTPYNYMVNSELTKKQLSPERGMLLVFLLESDLAQSDLNKILTTGNFDYAFSENIVIKNSSGLSLQLGNAQFTNVVLFNSEIHSFTCVNCSISNFRMSFCNTKVINLPRLSPLNTLYITNTKVRSCVIQTTEIKDVALTNINANILELRSRTIESLLFENYHVYQYCAIILDSIQNFECSESDGNFHILSYLTHSESPSLPVESYYISSCSELYNLVKDKVSIATFRDWEVSGSGRLTKTYYSDSKPHPFDTIKSPVNSENRYVTKNAFFHLFEVQD